jgi:hypothetical protein
MEDLGLIAALKKRGVAESQIELMKLDKVRIGYGAHLL